MNPKTAIIVCILVLLPGFLYTQTKRITQLEELLTKVDKTQRPAVLNELALEYLDINIEKSSEYANKAYKEAKKIKNKEEIADALNILGNIEYRSQNYKKAASYYEDEYKIRKQFQKNKELAIVIYNLALTYNLAGKDKKAIKYLEEALNYANKAKDKELMLKIYNTLASIAYANKEYKRAYGYLFDYLKLRDKKITESSHKQLTQVLEKVENIEQLLQEKNKKIKKIDSTLEIVEQEKETLQVVTQQQQLEIDKLNLENQLHKEKLKNQKLIQRFLLVSIVFVILLTILIYSRYLYRKRMNKKLEEQYELIKLQKEEIETQRDNLQQLNKELEIRNKEIALKNKELTDSITYARRIQIALLPSIEGLNELGENITLFYKPRDIVSGDFYWIKKINNKLFIIAADCTGHGVPGAFMSMLGVAFLNEIIEVNNNTEPHQILEELRTLVKKSLHQTTSDTSAKDGMDLAMIVVDTETNIVKYAGANNPLYYIRNKELTTIKPTRNPIGIYYKEKPFESHEIQAKDGDIYYMFSDGFTDQFGGEKNEKFKSKRFKQLLIDIHEYPPAQQQNMLEEALESWKQRHPQIDDILVIGYRHKI